MARTRATPIATCFAAPGGTSAADLVALLTDELGATVEPPIVEERTVLDTVDHDVRRAGLVIEATRAGERGTVIGVRQWGRAPDRLAMPIGVLPRRIDDLPPRFASLLPDDLLGAALVPVGTVCVAVQPLAVRDDEDKAVARISIDSIDGPLFVRVQPVRGYARAGAEAIATITSLGFRAGAEPLEALYDTAPATAPTPSPRVPANRAWVHALRGQLDLIDATLPAAIAGVDPEALHDLRVALRRTRAALRQSKGVLPKALRSCFRPELTHLQQATSAVRDLEVLRDMLAGRDGQGGDSLGALRAAVDARLAAARDEMVAILEGERTHALLADWRATLVAIGAAEADDDADEWGQWPARARHDVADVVNDRIARQRRRLLAAGRAINRESSAPALHEVRKQGKELRYLLELFAEHVPDTATPDAHKAMRSLQNSLGRHHDVAVQLELIRSLAESGPWSDRSAIEKLLAELDAAQETEREKFTTRFARVVASVRR